MIYYTQKRPERPVERTRDAIEAILYSYIPLPSAALLLMDRGASLSYEGISFWAEASSWKKI